MVWKNKRAMLYLSKSFVSILVVWWNALWKRERISLCLGLVFCFNPSCLMECSGRFDTQSDYAIAWAVSILVFQWNALEANSSILRSVFIQDFNPSFSMECSGRFRRYFKCCIRLIISILVVWWNGLEALHLNLGL